MSLLEQPLQTAAARTILGAHVLSGSTASLLLISNKPFVRMQCPLQTASDSILTGQTCQWLLSHDMPAMDSHPSNVLISFSAR